MQRISIFMILLISFLGPASSWAQPVSATLKNEEKIRQEMIVISRELGVTCTACHNVKNFKSDELQAFKVSKEHMKITQMLEENGMDGKKGPQATCYMCHRGHIKPEYKEPASKSTF